MATIYVENFSYCFQKLQQEQYLRTEQYNNTFGGKLQHLLSFNREARQHVQFLMNPQLLE